MLDRLELIVPPPLVMLAAAALNWGLARITPVMDPPGTLQTISTIALAASGIAVALAGLIAFRRADTTIAGSLP